MHLVFNGISQPFGNIKRNLGFGIYDADHFLAAHSESTVRTGSGTLLQNIGNALEDNISRLMSVCIVYIFEMVYIAHDDVYGLSFVQIAAHGIGKIFVKSLSVFQMGKLVGNSSLMLKFLFQSKLNGIHYLAALTEIVVIGGSKALRLFRNDNADGFSAR